jgi:hypothetical protein
METGRGRIWLCLMTTRMIVIEKTDICIWPLRHTEVVNIYQSAERPLEIMREFWHADVYKTCYILVYELWSEFKARTMEVYLAS